eukprot:16919-Heterococcus_DN1.PRE.2
MTGACCTAKLVQNVARLDLSIAIAVLMTPCGSKTDLDLAAPARASDVARRKSFAVRSRAQQCVAQLWGYLQSESELVKVQMQTATTMQEGTFRKFQKKRETRLGTA